MGSRCKRSKVKIRLYSQSAWFRSRSCPAAPGPGFATIFPSFNGAACAFQQISLVPHYTLHSTRLPLSGGGRRRRRSARRSRSIACPVQLVQLSTLPSSASTACPLVLAPLCIASAALYDIRYTVHDLTTRSRALSRPQHDNKSTLAAA